MDSALSVSESLTRSGGSLVRLKVWGFWDWKCGFTFEKVPTMLAGLLASWDSLPLGFTIVYVQWIKISHNHWKFWHTSPPGFIHKIGNMFSWYFLWALYLVVYWNSSCVFWQSASTSNVILLNIWWLLLLHSPWLYPNGHTILSKHCLINIWFQIKLQFSGL